MEHSKKYEDLKEYYENGYWSKRMLGEAVGKWITAVEYEEITGEPYQG